ncbi:MAG TPA: hypothetical protein VFZ70_10715 [Euzebyales bacterium]
MSGDRWLTSIGLAIDDPGQALRLREAERLCSAGRVMSLRTTPGRVEARVQGTHARPHLVELAVPVWTDEQWRTVSDLLARQARHHARLLAGQLPDQFDVALTELGLSLTPNADEWSLHCTCGDRAVPCIHQLAVWLAVHDQLDTDPYLVTRLRGRSREQLLADIRDRRGRGERRGIPIAELDVARWSQGSVHSSEVPLPVVRQPGTVAGPLRMLGDPPGWSGPADVVALLGPAVVAGAERARMLLSEDPDEFADGT